MGASDLIVVGVGTNNGVKSRLVKRATRSWCSHAWLEYSSLSFGGLWAIHAQPEGVVKQSIFDVWKSYPVNRRFELLGVSSTNTRRAIRNALAALGTPYDYGVIANAIKLIWWRYTGQATPVRRNPRELHCSEFVCLVLRDIGVPQDHQLDPEATTPGKLYNFMFGHPSFREI